MRGRRGPRGEEGAGCTDSSEFGNGPLLWTPSNIFRGKHRSELSPVYSLSLGAPGPERALRDKVYH